MQPRTIALLEDIKNSIGYIREDTSGMTVDEFVGKRQARQLVAHNFQIIGEAVGRMRRDDPTVAARLSGHNQIVAFRSALIHGYDVINYSDVWNTVQNALPVLSREVEALLRQGAE
jgi:uncharacterized protein with HEPN domain